MLNFTKTNKFLSGIYKPENIQNKGFSVLLMKKIVANLLIILPPAGNQCVLHTVTEVSGTAVTNKTFSLNK